MSLDHELEPRSVIPYTDDEIRELYLRARFGTVDGVTIEKVAAEQAAGSTFATVEVVVLTLLVYGLVSFFVQIVYGFEVALWVSAIAFLIVGVGLAKAVERRAIGPLSWLAHRRASRDMLAKLWGVNPFDSEVLQTVVQFIASEPLSQESDLVQAIEQDMLKIEASLNELPELAASLRMEIARTTDDGLKVLLESKHTAAMRTINRLTELSRELAAQADQAVEAVRPIRELVTRFDHIVRLSTSLSRIQAAHGLIEMSEQKLEDHRMELRLLRAASAAASARLKEIEQVVQAHEQAQAEIQAL